MPTDREQTVQSSEWAPAFPGEGLTHVPCGVTLRFFAPALSREEWTREFEAMLDKHAEECDA